LLSLVGWSSLVTFEIYAEKSWPKEYTRSILNLRILIIHLYMS
jgi:hypothetical protein